MKYLNVLLGAAAAFALASCENEAPDSKLSVTTDKAEYTAGETVNFHIDGDADNILFYSGEPGHEYEKRKVDTADNHLLVDFVSYTDYLSYVNPNFQVLISSDFNGIYDAENLAAATWTDVTPCFTLPEKTSTNTPSGQADLTQYVAPGKDTLFYLAVRYYDLPEGAQRNRWVVRSMNIVKRSPEGVDTNVADIKTAGWQNVIVSGNLKWTLPGTQLLAAGNATTQGKDFWAVSKGYNLRAAEPSTGVAVKNISTKVSDYKYTYTTPGTYNAVFVSTSVWYNSENSSLTNVRVVVK